jgi:transcriptional regulator with XRE-family HTH domain
MKKRDRVLTDADERALEKVRKLWAEYQKKHPDTSQEKAAHEAGMGQSAFSQFLRGAVPMRVSPVFKFAKLFGVKPTEIRPDLAQLAEAGAQVRAVQEPEAVYSVTPEALEVAKVFDRLNAEARRHVAQQVRLLLERQRGGRRQSMNHIDDVRVREGNGTKVTRRSKRRTGG